MIYGWHLLKAWLVLLDRVQSRKQSLSIRDKFLGRNQGCQVQKQEVRHQWQRVEVHQSHRQWRMEEVHQLKDWWRMVEVHQSHLQWQRVEVHHSFEADF